MECDEISPFPYELDERKESKKLEWNLKEWHGLGKALSKISNMKYK